VKKIKATLAALGVTLLVGVTVQPAEAASKYATRATAREHAGCQRIYKSYRNVGAGHQTAQWFAFWIAPRESGCVPQYVHNRTDWSYSVVGLNGLTPGLRAGWRRLCGRDVRTWQGYEADAKCALAAYRAMGTRPWRASR
jgi:hypothetical protein